MKRKMLYSFIVTVSVFLFSCKKDSQVGSSETPGNSPKTFSQTSTVADLTINTGMTLAQINQVIAAANSGQTVYVEPGTYTITGKIVMKAGVSLVKKTTTNPIFDATGAATEIFSASYGTELSSCTFSGITFWNYRFAVTNASNVTFKYCIFDYGERRAGTDESWYGDAYLQFLDTDATTVTNCTFCRRVNHSGRGVWLKSTTNSKILNCTFGNGGSTGYFVTGINDNSESNSLIDNNIMTRNPALNSDGAVKARNGQNVTISGNTFNDSGILLYEYLNTPAYPYLNYVKVLNNTINITSNVNDIYHGIGYYRDNTTGTEYSFRIEGNIVTNGTISFAGNNLDVANFNAANGGVYTNDYGILNLKAGISQSGNY